MNINSVAKLSLSHTIAFKVCPNVLSFFLMNLLILMISMLILMLLAFLIDVVYYY